VLSSHIQLLGLSFLKKRIRLFFSTSRNKLHTPFVLKSHIMAVEEKKRKHKDSSEKKSSKKKHKSVTKIIAPTSPASSVGSAAPIASTSFSEVVVKLYLHLAPMWSGKTMEGVNEQLNAFLMKYVYGLLEAFFFLSATTSN
jgi:hypothetical protein